MNPNHLPPRATPRCTRVAFTLVELLVVLAVIGILVGLLLPAVQTAREAARRMQCQNQLKQLGLATLHFESAERVFPASGWTQVGPGNPYGKYVGWRTVILPYLEQSNVRDLYRIDLNWWEGTNLAVASIPMKTFVCPSTPSIPSVTAAIAKSPRPALLFDPPLARADYEAVQGIQPSSIAIPIYNATNRFAVMHRNSRNNFASIVDGSSNTIMVAETAGRPTVFRRRAASTSATNDQGIGWADSEGAYSLDGSSVDGTREGCTPSQGCTAAMNVRNDNEPYSFHTGGASFLFADGHVSFLDQQIELSILAALCTRAAGEIQSEP